jgi:hypothetical protein
MADPFVIIDSDPFGIVATHPQRVQLPVLVAPVPDEQKSKNFNTIRQHLIVIACMRLPRRGFAFDSSILSPDSESAFRRFAKLMEGLRDRDDANPKRFPPCSVFGHTDPTGGDVYNKPLSGRRALALYGILTRSVAIWDELFLNPYGGDHWGKKAIQTMFSTSLKKPPKNPLEPPFYTGPIDGAKTQQTADLTNQAVSNWRVARGFTPGFTLDTTMRHQLFNEYMDALCHDPDGEPFVLHPTDFIAKGKAGKSLKGDVQGCSDFNVHFLLSKAKEDLAAKDPVLAEVRNDLYLDNRRAVVFAFQYGTEIDPTKWPCPTARDPNFVGCTVRFWSDHKQRAKEIDDDRTFGENMSFLDVDENNQLVETPIEQTGNTMRCRFYHGFAVNSPCEAKFKEWVIRFKVPSFNGQLQVLSFRRYVVKVGESENSPVIRGNTDEFGVVRIPVFDEKTSITIRIDAGRDLTEDDNNPPDDAPVDESTFLSFVLAGGLLHNRDIDDELAVKQRLYNLGFGEHPPDSWADDEFQRAFAAFQHRNNLDNASDDDVRREVMKQHDLVGIPSPPPDDDSSSNPQNSGSSAAPLADSSSNSSPLADSHSGLASTTEDDSTSSPASDNNPDSTPHSNNDSTSSPASDDDSDSKSESDDDSGSDTSGT